MTKGDVLENLKSEINIFSIPEFICFTVDEWWKSSNVQNARSKFISQNIDTSQTILDQIKNL